MLNSNQFLSKTKRIKSKYFLINGKEKMGKITK